MGSTKMFRSLLTKNKPKNIEDFMHYCLQKAQKI